METQFASFKPLLHSGWRVFDLFVALLVYKSNVFNLPSVTLHAYFSELLSCRWSSSFDYSSFQYLPYPSGCKNSKQFD